MRIAGANYVKGKDEMVGFILFRLKSISTPGPSPFPIESCERHFKNV